MKDTKYQSVYVISEEKDECVIATEVGAACQADGQTGTPGHVLNSLPFCLQV